MALSSLDWLTRWGSVTGWTQWSQEIHSHAMTLWFCIKGLLWCAGAGTAPSRQQQLPHRCSQGWQQRQGSHKGAVLIFSLCACHSFL